MAERRMFSRRIIKADAFMQMPVSCRELYYQLCMDADDDGFVSNPLTVMKMCGATTNDIDVLVAKRFVMTFESGVLLIKHWLIHNELKRDRYKPSTHQDEKSLVRVKENSVYSLDEGEPMTFWRQLGNNLSPQNRIGKDSIGKVSKEERARHEKDFERFWTVYPRKVAKQKAREWWLKRYFTTEEVDRMVASVLAYCKTEQWAKGFIPHPTTYLNQGRFDDEIAPDQMAQKQLPSFKSYSK